MPPPELLREYEAVCPGLADRMFAFVEKQGEHNREIERQIVLIEAARSKSQFGEARLGQYFAFLITVASLASGAYTAIQGHEVAGSIIGVGGIGGIVATFIYGRTQQTKQQHEPTPGPSPK